MAEHVITEIDGAVGTLTLNRPDKLNAFFGTMRDEIGEGIEALTADDRVRAMIITGAGRAFCTGADVRYLAELMDGDRLAEAKEFVEAGHRAILSIARTPKPVVAALNGPAAGGGAALALACDLRLASDRATIGLSFGNIGLHPDWGATYFLPRLVGAARAAELFFLGKMVEAERAAELGLVNRVVPHEDLMDQARALAERLASRPALSMELAKRAVLESAHSTIEEMLDYEVRAQVACFHSEDAAEGVQAFLDKRPARFGRQRVESADGAG